MSRSRGAVALDKASGSVNDKAAKLRAATSAVYGWLRGDRVPREGRDGPRMRIEDAYGIPCAWWLEASNEPEATAGAPIVATPGAATPEAVADEADLLLADVQACRADVAAMQGGDAGERIRNLEKCASMLHKLADIRGIMQSPRAILASPHWKVIAATLTAALTPHPEAAQAVANALKGLE